MEDQSKIIKSNLVSVVILNWNGMRYLSKCIEGVHLQDYRPIEIIVVDNGSSDESVSMLRSEHPDISLVIHPVNLGFAQGMNTGISVSQGEFLLLLNEDAYLAQDFVAKGIAEFKADPLLAWVGGLVYESIEGKKTNIVLNAVSALKFRFQFRNLLNSALRQESLMGSSCAMLLRRISLDDIRLGDDNWLDKQYFAYWEDIDLALRLWLRGWKCLFTPVMRLWHDVSGSVGGKRRLEDKPILFQRLSLRNRYWTIIKNVPIAVICYLIPYLLLVELLVLPYFVLISPRTVGCSIGAMWDVAISLPKIIKYRRFIQRNRKISNRRFLSLFRGY
jgi:hypothetical protein